MTEQQNVKKVPNNKKRGAEMFAVFAKHNFYMPQ